jgi:hypothetical protein
MVKKKRRKKRAKNKLRYLGRNCEICERKLYGRYSLRKYCDYCRARMDRLTSRVSRCAYDKRRRAKIRLEKLNLQI